MFIYIEPQVLQHECVLPCCCSHLLPTEKPPPCLCGLSMETVFLVAFRAQTSLWSARQLPASGTADFDLSARAVCSSASCASFKHFNPPLPSSPLLPLLADADTYITAGTCGGWGVVVNQITLWPTAGPEPTQAPKNLLSSKVLCCNKRRRVRENALRLVCAQRCTIALH